MKIIVIEDIAFIRDQLVQVLSELQDIEVVWDGPQTLEVVAVAAQTCADVVILNISMAQALLSEMIFDIIRALGQVEPRPYIIVLGDRYDTTTDKAFAKKIWQSGADQYLNRSYELIKLPRFIQALKETGK